MLAAAGNDGLPGNRRNWKAGNVVCPASAKNVVAVGSHRNLDMKIKKEGKEEIPFLDNEQHRVNHLSDFSSR